MSEHKPPSIEACLDKPADAPIPDRRARGMVSSDKMMYWHERAMRAEAALSEAYQITHYGRGTMQDVDDVLERAIRGSAHNPEGKHG